LKADFGNPNEIGSKSAKPSQLFDFGLPASFIRLRPFASFCVVFGFDVTRNVTRRQARSNPAD
jgi:hypothetical protein